MKIAEKYRAEAVALKDPTLYFFCKDVLKLSYTEAEKVLLEAWNQDFIDSVRREIIALLQAEAYQHLVKDMSEGNLQATKTLLNNNLLTDLDIKGKPKPITRRRKKEIEKIEVKSKLDEAVENDWERLKGL